MRADTLISLITLGLFAWAIIWSHSAFRRWEQRDEAKVKALQRIATELQKKNGDAQKAEIENITANW